jgi:hypothetical protein
MNVRESAWARALASIFIIYIVAAMFALPAIEQLPILTRPFIHFGRLVGMAIRWNFFAPFPMSANYFEYLVFKEGQALPIASGRFPEEAEVVTFDNGRRRMLMISQSMATDLTKVDKYLVPWLCRNHPEAKWVNYRKVVVDPPDLDWARQNLNLPVEQMMQKRTKFEKSTDCPKAAQ